MLVWKTWLLLLLPGSTWTWCQDIGTRCDDGEFKCKSGICIDINYQCDGENDCGDYSDEHNCQEEYENKCRRTNFFMCEGDCRPTRLQCNGNEDCTDGLDEAFCEKPTTIPILTTKLVLTTPTSPQPICIDNQFQCNSGKCIDFQYRCDGESDCNDFTDEANCEQEYNSNCGNPDSFMCDSKCFPKQLQCNGFADCIDGLDEAFCDTPTAPAPTTTEEVFIFDYDYNDVAASSPEAQYEPSPDVALESRAAAPVYSAARVDNDNSEPEVSARPRSYQPVTMVGPNPVENDIPSFDYLVDIVEVDRENEDLERTTESEVPTDSVTYQASARYLNLRRPSEQAVTSEPSVTKRYKEWELDIQEMPSQRMNTLVSLLKNIPRSAIRNPSYTLPKATAEKAKDILRDDPEALIAILDVLGEDVPEGEEKQGQLPQVRYTGQEDGEDWIPLTAAHKLPQAQNDTLLESVLDVLYSLWAVAQESAVPVPSPMEKDEASKDIVAVLFQLFDEDSRITVATTSFADKEPLEDVTSTTMTEALGMDEEVVSEKSEFLKAQNLVEDDGQPIRLSVSPPTESGGGKDQDDLTQSYGATKLTIASTAATETRGPQTSFPAAATTAQTFQLLKTTGEEVQMTTTVPDCTGEGDCGVKEDSSEDTDTDGATAHENEQPDETKELDVKAEYGESEDYISTTPQPTYPTSTHTLKLCQGPGPVLYAADHHFCLNDQPYHPVSAYIKLHPNSDMESIHVYLVVLQLTGGDMAVLRLDPVLLRKIGNKKLVEIVNVATKMSIPIMLEIHVGDMSKMREQLLALSQTIKQQNGLFLGWNFQINNRTTWTINKRRTAKNTCMNETASLESIRSFKNEVKELGHLFTLTIIEDEPDIPTFNNTKKVVRKNCEYNPEKWTDLTVEISDFQIFDPNGNSAMTPVFTINKHVPLLLRSAHAPVGDKNVWKRPGEYSYGGFLVDAETTVASFLRLRQFKNFVPAV